jgi:hypothetical protein
MADSASITPWPGAGWVFDPPPGWPVGRDFDPFRGKGVLAEWPDAPEDWKFWAPAALAASQPLDAQGEPVVPVAGDGRSAGRAHAARWAIRILVVVLVLGGGSWLWNHVGPGEVVKKDGIGSCWASAKGQAAGTYEPVSCTQGGAEYTVSSEAADESGCPTDTDSYMEKTGGGVWCLKPIP